MDREAVANAVKAVLVTELDLAVPIEAIDEEDNLFSPHIRMDSLGHLRVLAGLEDRFALRAPRGRLEEALLETVGDLVDLVVAHLPGRA